jgi:SAM-dependent methyltransferase
MFKKKNYINPNKYLIKKKKFIKDFEGLYRDIKDPWFQKKNFLNDETVVILKPFLNEFINQQKKTKLLDVGAASGYLKKIIKKKIKYIGTDIHKKNYKNIIYDDIKKFNKKFKNNFNIIVSLRTIYYLAEDINKALENFYRYLKKKGILIISYNSKKNSFSNKYFTDLKLRKMLIKYFTEVYTIEINRELSSKNFNKEKLTLFIFRKGR